MSKRRFKVMVEGWHDDWDDCGEADEHGPSNAAYEYVSRMWEPGEDELRTYKVQVMDTNGFVTRHEVLAEIDVSFNVYDLEEASDAA